MEALFYSTVVRFPFSLVPRTFSRRTVQWHGFCFLQSDSPSCCTKDFSPLLCYLISSIGGPPGTVTHAVPTLSPLTSPIQLTATTLPITGILSRSLERTKNVSLVKSDPVYAKVKGGSLVNGSDIQQSMPSAVSHAGTSRSGENQRQVGESTNRTLNESTMNIP
ncbi:hypothetical protein PVL29_013376 [Vitis rotundifolia]|uniref:Uncharacterized protein n=1 Tax=Vitis rotundifolia TaxID=103349 RepID=A0AA39DR49_VITRO|nr:hypothetical protein PVL29_013376 [Vitis rotundifolia]